MTDINQSEVQNEWRRPEPIIYFVYEDVRYKVDISAYPYNYIGLPDGRVLAASMWAESYPPQACGLHVVENVDQAKVIPAQLAPQVVSNEPLIHFEFEGVHYTVDMKAYYTNYIGLPDGRVIESNGWLESYPPQACGLHVVDIMSNSSKVVMAKLKS